jgi:hypothetical protein
VSISEYEEFMPGTVQRTPAAIKIDGVPPMSYETGCDSFVLALLTAAAPLGIEVSYPMLKGLSASAFRLMFPRDWRRYAPDALQGYDHSRLAYVALGLHVDVFEVNPTDPASIALVQPVVSGRIAAGYPLLGLQMMGWEDWGVIAGYSGACETLLVRTPHEQGSEPGPAKSWPWLIHALSGAGPAPNRKGSIQRSLRTAIELHETSAFGEYASGQAAYRFWIDGLHEEEFYAPFEAGNPAEAQSRLAELLAAEAGRQGDVPFASPYLERVHVNNWRLKSLTDARKAAAAYLEEAAGLMSSEVGARLAAAGRDYDEAAQLLGMARPFAPSEGNLQAQPWTQRQRDKQAALLQQAAEVEDAAIAAIRAAMARMK